jgi:cytidyltransferase-like protein
MSHGDLTPKDDLRRGGLTGAPVPSEAREEAPGAATPACLRGLQAPSSSVVERPQVLSLDSFPHAKAHLEKFPFRAPERVHECVAWYEGSFNPMHEGHAYTVQKLLYMGFRTVVVGTVPKNPHKVGLPILPLDERVEAIKDQLLEMRMPLVDNSKERGVFVTATPESFHDERLRAWYRDNWYVIMGPDNFQTYFEENRAWALFAAKDEEMKDFSRFRRLYETFLKDRILVNDEKYAYHATDIRKGSVAMMPAIERRLGNLVRGLGQDEQRS